MFNFNYSIPSCICSILTSVELLVYVQFKFSRTFRLCLVLTTVEPIVMSPFERRETYCFSLIFFTASNSASASSTCTSSQRSLSEP